MLSPLRDLLSRFRDRDHTRGSLLASTTVLSLPSVIAGIGGFGLFQLIDLYILGELGPDAVAAAGATNQVVRQVVFLLIMGITVASQMMISQLVGMGNVRGAKPRNLGYLLALLPDSASPGFPAKPGSFPYPSGTDCPGYGRCNRVLTNVQPGSIR